MIFDLPSTIVLYGEYHDCRGVNQVLRSDPDNVKGLFRTGQLHLRLKNIETAKVGMMPP